MTSQPSSRLEVLRARLQRVATHATRSTSTQGEDAESADSAVPREVPHCDDAYRVIIASDGTFVGELRS